MYMQNEDRPVCPVCKKKLELHKIDRYNFTLYHWYCNCLVDIEINNIEPDVTHYFNKGD